MQHCAMRPHAPNYPPTAWGRVQGTKMPGWLPCHFLYCFFTICDSPVVRMRACVRVCVCWPMPRPKSTAGVELVCTSG